MADRTCATCGKRFDKPSYLKRHQLRKTSCAPIVTLIDLTPEEQAKPVACRFCGHRFSHPSGLSKHMKKSCKIAGSEEGMEKLYAHTLKRQLDEQRKEATSLKEQLAEMTKMMQQLQSAVLPAAAASAAQPMIAYQQEAQTINNGPMQQININVFGQESTKHIDRKTIKDMLDGVLEGTRDPAQGAVAAFLKTAMLIYSDPSHPENLTCYLPNNKKNDVLVHGESGWEVQPYTVVLPPMAAKSVDALFDNQPFVDADKYGDLMKAVSENEQAYKEGKEMRTVLVRNKDLLKQILGALPK